jgi:hypothetical protein
MICNALQEEYEEFLYDDSVFKDSKGIKRWDEFIKKKNLGIICIKSTYVGYDDIYKIVDEKKWALSKIKYGF